MASAPVSLSTRNRLVQTNQQNLSHGLPPRLSLIGPLLCLPVATAVILPPSKDLNYSPPLLRHKPLRSILPRIPQGFMSASDFMEQELDHKELDEELDNEELDEEVLDSEVPDNEALD